MPSLREQILVKRAPRLEPVEVPEWASPEWDGTVYIRPLTGKERDAFEESSLVKRGKTREATLRNIRARLVCLAACDESGAPIFSAEDAEQLGNQDARPLDRLYAKAAELSGISEADVEELVKNS